MSAHPRTHPLLVASLVAAGVLASILPATNGPGPEVWAHFAPYTILPALVAAAAVWLLRRRALWEQLAGAIIAIYAVVWLHSARTDPQWSGGFTLEGLGNWSVPAVFGLPILLITAALWGMAILVTRFAGRPRTGDEPGDTPVSVPEAVDASDHRVALRLLAAGIAIGTGAFFAFAVVLYALSIERNPGLLIAVACAVVLPGLLSALAASLPRVNPRLGPGAAILVAILVSAAVSFAVNWIGDVGEFLLPASLSALACGLIAWWVLSAIMPSSSSRAVSTRSEPSVSAEDRSSARI